MTETIAEEKQIERRELGISDRQAEMLVDVSRQIREAQGRLNAMAEAILAGFDDLPKEYELEEVGDDPPQLVISHRLSENGSEPDGED